VGPLVFKTSGAALGAARWVRLPRVPATEERECRIVRVPRDEVRRLEGRPHFLLDGQLVGLVDAVQVLELSEPGAAEDPMPEYKSRASRSLPVPR